ncbi:MAG TPA: Gfo/Idh/MocA family oxidoreductase, partial [Planctomycetota bacterium]|nr:Gfo/Idh/MocA family oxidoreductase [Planctomycetota bacterium]
MSRLRIAVVGVGHLGRHHARLLGELDCTLVAVADVDERARAQAEQAYAVPAMADYRELAGRVDAVTVAVPTRLHREVAGFFLQHDIDVLVEKPIADSVGAGQQLVDLARRHGRVLQVGHVERFNAVLQSIAEFGRSARYIESHRLAPFSFRSTDIGVVLDLMIHDLEIILHLVRSPVQNIDAVGVPVLSRGEDIANARIRFENGCVANVTSSRISPERMRKIRVFQEDAYLSLDYEKQSGEIYR